MRTVRGMQSGQNHDDQRLTAVEAKLDVLIRLVALQLARNEGTLEARALLLDRAGLAQKEIARVCDTTTGSVSVRLAEARRQTKKAKRGRSR